MQNSNALESLAETRRIIAEQDRAFEESLAIDRAKSSSIAKVTVKSNAPEEVAM